MRVPDEAELLALWERGCTLHPIDRALMFGHWARPELPQAHVAALPVGALNAAVLRFRRACFGSRIDAWVDCESCGGRMELVLDVGALLADAAEGDRRPELDVAGCRFRAPDSRDLAAVASEQDPGAAALRLLERCCVQRADAKELAGLLARVEEALESLDPTAAFDLSLTCPCCAHRWTAGLHVAELLWDEVDARAQRLLAQVHALAHAYGWTESDVLALSPRRRAAYLEMVGA